MDSKTITEILESVPVSIAKRIKDYKSEINNIGRSGDIVVCIGNKYILKITDNSERAERERYKLEWLKDKLPVAEVIEFIKDDNKVYTLQTMLSGKNLCDKYIMNNPDNVCRLLADGIKLLNKQELKSCPFDSGESKGNDFIHGDFCLPNILTDGEKITGIVDIEGCGKGDRLSDISWAIWSLCYNLGTDKYVDTFMKYLGEKFNREKFIENIPPENLSMINFK